MSEELPAEAAYPLGPDLDFLKRLWRLNHALEKLSLRMEKRLGVTAQQRLVLRSVGKYPGLTAGHLASTLFLDPGTISASLNRLEQRGLLERRRDPKDKRRVCLGLTAKGRALDVPAERTVESVVEQLLGSVPDTELRAMLEVTEKLTQLLLDAASDG